MKYASVLIVFYVFVQLSCTSKQKWSCKTANMKQQITLKKQQEITFNIPKLVNYNFFQENFREINGEMFFWGYDLDNEKLFIHKFSGKHLNKILDFSKEGVNQLPFANYNIYFHNYDSIFFLSDHPIRLYLADSSGTIYSRIKLDKDLYKTKGEFGTYFFRDLSALFQVDKNLIHFFYIQIYELPQSPKIQYKQPLEVVINYKKRRVQTLFGKYPQEYTNYDSRWYPNLHYSSHCIFYDSLTVLSLGASNLLQIYNNKTGELIKEVCANSRFINTIEPISIQKNNQQDITNFTNSSAFYRNIIYDKYRKLFLRIVKHNQDLRDKTGALNQMENAPWSIIWLNENMEIVGETKFLGKKYDFRKIKIISKGLLINKLIENEGEITYELFKIIEKH